MNLSMYEKDWATSFLPVLFVADKVWETYHLGSHLSF